VSFRVRQVGAAHDVRRSRRALVDWRGLIGGEYRPLERSAPIDLGPDELAAQIDWP
jgi:hypothetical protein